jgi:putative transposase
LTQQLRSDGHSLNQALQVVGLAKRVWYYHQAKTKEDDKYASAKSALLKIAEDDSAYGYRKAKPELTEKYGLTIGYHTTRKLMGELELIVARKRTKPEPSVILKAVTKLGDKANLIRQLQEQEHVFKICEAVVTDFTEIIYDHGKKSAQLMSIIGYREKVCWGWSLSPIGTAKAALTAWAKAKRMRRRWKFKVAGLIVHHDLGSTYTSWAWLKKVLTHDKVKVSWALRGARDNPEMESFNSHFKNENRSLFWECESFAELTRVIADRIRYYNHHRRHQSLANRKPIEYIKSKGKLVKKK